MITRFYADNYKCLQNFEYRPQQFELIIGANGTGKSTVFEAIDKIRQFVSGQEDAKALFPSSCATRWSRHPKTIFEVDFLDHGIEYQYRLELNIYSTSSYKVEKETLYRSGKLFLETKWDKREISDGQSFHKLDEYDLTVDHVGEIRTLYWANGLQNSLSNFDQSVLAYIAPDFMGGLLRFNSFKLNPALMTSRAGKATPYLYRDLSNFASYYLYLLQQKQGTMFEMITHLRETIPDFDSFAIEEDFEEARRNLQIVCKRQGKQNGSSASLKYSFDEMSDGQRALIALYTLLFCTLEPDSTLVIDEPENYIALRELQPWLMLLRERLEEYGGQVILISHHPEFINALAPSHTTVFERENSGPIRVKPFESNLLSTLAPSEIVARGWENE